jgi:hypothetical protein
VIKLAQTSRVFVAELADTDPFMLHIYAARTWVYHTDVGKLPAPVQHQTSDLALYPVFWRSFFPRRR